VFKEDEEIYPIFVSQRDGAEHHINLLLYHEPVFNDDGVETGVRQHYCYIKDLSTLLRKTYRNAVGRKRYENKHVCPNCLNAFSRKHVRDAHFTRCRINEPQKITVCEEDEFLEFKEHSKKFKHPLIGMITILHLTQSIFSLFVAML
jgi:hypothetical protein